MNIENLSASAYGSWDWCEWKYFLNYQLGFVEETGVAALVGTLAHHVLELLSKASMVKHDKKSKIWDINYLWNICFNRYYNDISNVAEQITDDKLRKVSKGLIELINSPHSPIRDNTIGVEIPFNICMKDPRFLVDINKYLRIRGRIDRVDKINNETIEIIDYKSGSSINWDSSNKEKFTPLSLHTKIQPRIYHLACKELYPWAKNVLITFIYFTDGGAITVPFCDTDIVDTYNMIYDRIKTIKNNDDPKRIDNFKCKMCNFKKDGTCENLWQEKNELGIHFLINKYKILNNKK